MARSWSAIGLALSACLALLCFFPGTPVVQASDGSVPVWGGDLRLRGEGFDNALDLDDSRDDSYAFYRMRYRISLDTRPREGLRLYFRLGNEYRWGVHSGGVRDGVAFEAASIRDAESRISLDNGWAEITGGPSGALSLKLGRMDLAYGEGLLVFDGTPSDGSSSQYFDAILMGWRKEGASLDLFTAKLADEGFGTRARDEDLFGLYGRRRALEGYLLYRDKRGPTATTSGIPHPRQNTIAVGTRVTVLPETGLHLAAEAAYQSGRYHDRDPAAVAPDDDRRAYGGYLRGGWTAGHELRPGLEIGGVYLSGDDPETGRYEGWDGFYGEWPKYSELLIYSMYDNTTRVGIDAAHPASFDDAGTWTNLAAVWLEGRLRPHRMLRASLRGTWVRAAEDPVADPRFGDFRRDRERGVLLAGQVDLTPADGLTAQVLGESFDPGGFYGPGVDPAWYGRFQVTARF